MRSTCPGAAPPPPGREIFSPPISAAAAYTPAACSVVFVRVFRCKVRAGVVISWCARRVLIYGIPTRITGLTRINKKLTRINDARPSENLSGGALGEDAED